MLVFVQDKWYYSQKGVHRMILPIQQMKISGTTFKGLTGNTSSEGFDIGEGNLRYFEHTNYYPFLDESKEAIDEYVRRAESSYIGLGMEISRSISVKERLPFTENEYFQYMGKKGSNLELAEADLFVEKALDKISDISDVWRPKKITAEVVQKTKAKPSLLKKLFIKLFK